MRLRKKIRSLLPEKVRKAVRFGRNVKPASQYSVFVSPKIFKIDQDDLKDIPNELHDKYTDRLKKHMESENYRIRRLSVQMMKKSQLHNMMTIKLRKKGQITTGMLVMIFEYLQYQPSMVHVITDSPKEKLPINFEKINYIEPGSLEEVEVLMTSNVVITDGELPAYFNRQTNQEVINLLNDFIYNLDEIHRPLTKEKIRFQRILLHSSKIIVPVGVHYLDLLDKFSIKTLYHGSITSNFDAQIEFNRIDKLNPHFFNIKKPWALKDYFEKKSYNGITLVDLVTDNSNKLSNHDLKKIISQVQNQNSNVRPLVRINAKCFDKFYKDKSLKEYIIGAQKNLEPWFSEVTSVISDSEVNLAQFKNVKKYVINREFNEQLIYPIETADYPERIEKKYTDKKISILLYSGGMFNNGITSSVLNLSNKLDYEKYSLTIIEKGNFDDASVKNIEKLSKKVNFVQRWGIGAFDDVEQLLHDEINKGDGFQNWMKSDQVFGMYQHELKRFLGTEKFDFAIDFGGYTSYYASMILAVKSKQKSIFLHNDMWKDAHRWVNSELPNYKTLMRVFTLYPFFDKLASVSQEVMEENKKNLGKFASPQKFITVKNLINEEDIFQKLNVKNLIDINQNKQDYYLNFPNDLKKKTGILLESELKIAPNKEKFTFIMAGRLSPEKAHKKMMDAVFKLVNEGYTEFEVLILGDGPLKESLVEYRNAHQLQYYIKFVGQVSNPYWYYKHSNSFLMTSDYEGQPMVLLEASVIGMPILATNIPGNQAVLSKTNGGVLVKNNVQALYEGMKKFIDNPNKLTLSSMNAISYNKETMQFFEKMVLSAEDK